MSKLSVAELTYLRLKKVFSSDLKRRRDEHESQPFAAGRDPRSLGAIVKNISHERGWDASLGKGQVLDKWAQIVGEEIASHTTPSMVGNDLIVRCSSTAWAANLRMMRSSLLGSIREAVPNTQIDSLHFKGPDAPSWQHGPRTIPGRGPRDTYG